MIAYAPPGFPFLVGLSYFVLGVGDLSAILVSIVAGPLTIPAVAWLARRTFGSGAGGVAAAFAALSGAHVAFSRMALTDASFLLFWVLALIQGQRFLERPGAVRAVLLGLAVGAAQLFKYNGWLAGVNRRAVGRLLAGHFILANGGPARRRPPGAGASLAALVAAIVYWPWFAFVQSHGGYGALLAHQRGYLGGLAPGPAISRPSSRRHVHFPAEPIWLASAGLAAAAGVLLIGFDDS